MAPHDEFDIEKYLAWLASPDPYQRDIALHVFWHTGTCTPQIAERLITILATDDQEKIRRAATSFVASLVDVQFTQALIERLGDEDWCVKGHAFLGLMRIDPRLAETHPRVRAFIDEETHPWSRFCIHQGLQSAA